MTGISIEGGWHTASTPPVPGDIGGLAAAYAALGKSGRIAGWDQLAHEDADRLARAFLADFAADPGTDMARFAAHWLPRWPGGLHEPAGSTYAGGTTPQPGGHHDDDDTAAPPA